MIQKQANKGEAVRKPVMGQAEIVDVRPAEMQDQQVVPLPQKSAQQAEENKRQKQQPYRMYENEPEPNEVANNRSSGNESMNSQKRAALV